MITEWWPKETTNHQDHVIAHVIGATVLGYFIFDEALYLLLDIGFIWKIYLDGEMVLLPHPVATAELEVEQVAREEIKSDVDLMMRHGASADDMRRLRPAPAVCVITEVGFFTTDGKRRLLLTGEEAHLLIETTIDSGEIQVSEAG